MKKILLSLILFPLLGYSQYAASSFVTLNKGMEDAYLKIEKLWSEYHKEAVKKGHKNSWSIWKVDPTGYDDKSIKFLLNKSLYCCIVESVILAYKKYIS